MERNAGTDERAALIRKENKLAGGKKTNTTSPKEPPTTDLESDQE